MPPLTSEGHVRAESRDEDEFREGVVGEGFHGCLASSPIILRPRLCEEGGVMMMRMMRGIGGLTSRRLESLERMRINVETDDTSSQEGGTGTGSSARRVTLTLASQEVKVTHVAMETTDRHGSKRTEEKGEEEEEEEEESNLKRQLRELEARAALKEQEREQLLKVHKRKSQMLQEMERKRRRTTFPCPPSSPPSSSTASADVGCVSSLPFPHKNISYASPSSHSYSTSTFSTEMLHSTSSSFPAEQSYSSLSGSSAHRVYHPGFTVNKDVSLENNRKVESQPMGEIVRDLKWPLSHGEILHQDFKSPLSHEELVTLQPSLRAVLSALLPAPHHDLPNLLQSPKAEARNNTSQSAGNENHHHHNHHTRNTDTTTYSTASPDLSRARKEPEKIVTVLKQLLKEVSRILEEGGGRETGTAQGGEAEGRQQKRQHVVEQFRDKAGLDGDAGSFLLGGGGVVTGLSSLWMEASSLACRGFSSYPCHGPAVKEPSTAVRYLDAAPTTAARGVCEGQCQAASLPLPLPHRRQPADTAGGSGTHVHVSENFQDKRPPGRRGKPPLHHDGRRGPPHTLPARTGKDDRRSLSAPGVGEGINPATIKEEQDAGPGREVFDGPRQTSRPGTPRTGPDGDPDAWMWTRPPTSVSCAGQLAGSPQLAGYPLTTRQGLPTPPPATTSRTGCPPSPTPHSLGNGSTRERLFRGWLPRLVTRRRHHPHPPAQSPDLLTFQHGGVVGAVSGRIIPAQGGQTTMSFLQPWPGTGPGFEARSQGGDNLTNLQNSSPRAVSHHGAIPAGLGLSQGPGFRVVSRENHALDADVIDQLSSQTPIHSRWGKDDALLVVRDSKEEYPASGQAGTTPPLPLRSAQSVRLLQHQQQSAAGSPRPYHHAVSRQLPYPSPHQHPFHHAHYFQQEPTEPLLPTLAQTGRLHHRLHRAGSSSAVAQSFKPSPYTAVLGPGHQGHHRMEAERAGGAGWLASCCGAVETEGGGSGSLLPGTVAALPGDSSEQQDGEALHVSQQWKDARKEEEEEEWGEEPTPNPTTLTTPTLTTPTTTTIQSLLFHSQYRTPL
ncbi:hypothetical protein ACOMHN_023298 [Nucella lapillus]